MTARRRAMDGLSGWTVVILAGGLGTRLGALTQACPKSMVEVAGEPFIAHQLRQLAAMGVGRIVLCLGHRGGTIIDYVGDGSRFGIAIGVSHDGETLRGTGGALRRAIPHLGERFFVLYGDSYLPIPFGPVAQTFHSAKRPALMTVLRNGGRWDRSNATFSRGKVLYNKRTPGPEMTYIDYGLGILSAAVFDGWPENRSFDLADLYQQLSERGDLAGHEVFDRFFEIGSPQGLRETEAFLRAARADAAATGDCPTFPAEARHARPFGPQ